MNVDHSLRLISPHSLQWLHTQRNSQQEKRRISQSRTAIKPTECLLDIVGLEQSVSCMASESRVCLYTPHLWNTVCKDPHSSISYHLFISTLALDITKRRSWRFWMIFFNRPRSTSLSTLRSWASSTITTLYWANYQSTISLSITNGFLIISRSNSLFVRYLIWLIFPFRLNM